MFQKEVAERIVAAPGTDAYGRLVVLAQWRSDAADRLGAPAARLHPAAQGDERRRAARRGSTRRASRPRARPCRGHRRRLRPAPQDAARQPRAARAGSEALLAAAGITPTERAERVSLEAFCRLARIVAARRADAQGA